MSGFDEDMVKPRNSVALSEEELSLLSVTEIDQRIALLQSEIERLKTEMDTGVKQPEPFPGGAP